MVIRFNIYLDDESETLFNELMDGINSERREEVMLMKEKCSVNIKKYKKIGKSELMQQLIKRFYSNEKKIIIDNLNHYNRLVEIEENKLKAMNKGKWNKSGEQEQFLDSLKGHN